MTTLDLLATLDDLHLPDDLDDTTRARAERLLVQASARFRREARQQFTPGESIARLKVTNQVVSLPQWPVVDVLTVTTDSGRPVNWRRLSPTGQELTIDDVGVRTIRPGITVLEGPTQTRRPAWVNVHYTHGGPVPADVVGAVAAAVERVLHADPEAARGAQQTTDTDTRGPFTRSTTRTFSPWAVGGQLLLSPDDLALARSYRTRTPKSWVTRP